MQSHSAAFDTAMKKSQRVEYLRGTVGTVSFDSRNILSASYSNACTDTKDVKFGSARIGQLTITFNGLSIAWNAWRGKTITLEYGLQLADRSVEYIPVGVFKIAKAEHKDTGVTVTAYDCLAELDIPFNVNTTYGKIYDFLELASLMTGVPNGRTSRECSSLPNGTETLGLYPQNDITTVRDFTSWIASTVGGFVTAGRNGELLIKSFSECAVVDTFQSRHRVVGSVFSDYATNYDGINIQNAEGDIQYYSSEYSTGGVSISLGQNPFLQYGVEETKTRQRTALAEVAHGIAYTPFNIAILNCPVYDLGDLVVCEGGVAEGSLTCCVMGIEWTFKNTTTLKGFGSDPNLTSGKTATDRALTGALSKTKENEIVIHTFVNSESHTLVDEVPQTILSIDFATVKSTTVTMNHEINLDLTLSDPTATVTAYYYLDDVLEYYEPVETYGLGGKHLLSLMYFLEHLAGGTRHEWKVKLEVSGGTATIDVGDVHAWLQGQGLVALESFDGDIELEDTFTPYVRGKSLVGIGENISLTTQMPIRITVSDSFTPYVRGRSLVGLSDTYSLTAQAVQYTRITEDGDTRITEDGGIRLTEE